MKTVTINDVIGWDPCYLREADKGKAYLRKLYSAHEHWTALQIIDEMPGQGVPPEDILWTVLRPEMIDEPALHELACRFAEAALEAERSAGREPDPRSWAAIAAKRAWLRGEIDDEDLAAAWAAAGDAAWAARDAARDAAWAAAWAARDAARAAQNAQLSRMLSTLEVQP